MTPDQEQWNEEIQSEKAQRLARRTGFLGPVAPDPKPGSRRPFKRASALYMQIMDLRASMQNDLAGLQMALSMLPPYVSRGHSRRAPRMARTILGRWTENRSKPYPTPGKSEAERRAFQRMSKAERAYIRSIESEVVE